MGSARAELKCLATPAGSESRRLRSRLEAEADGKRAALDDATDDYFRRDLMAQSHASAIQDMRRPEDAAQRLKSQHAELESFTLRLAEAGEREKQRRSTTQRGFQSAI